MLTDNIGMFYHNYDLLLTSVLNSFVYDFNTAHSTGIDLKKNSTIKLLSTLVRQSVITPY